MTTTNDKNALSNSKSGKGTGSFGKMVITNEKTLHSFLLSKLHTYQQNKPNATLKEVKNKIKEIDKEALNILLPEEARNYFAKRTGEIAFQVPDTNKIKLLTVKVPEEMLQEIEKKSKSNKRLAAHEESQKSAGFTIDQREAREALKDKKRAKEIEKKLEPFNKNLKKAKTQYSEALTVQKHVGHQDPKKSKAADEKMEKAGIALFEAAKAYVKAEISAKKLHLSSEEINGRIVAKKNEIIEQVMGLHLSDKEMANLQKLNEYLDIGSSKSQRVSEPALKSDAESQTQQGIDADQDPAAKKMADSAHRERLKIAKKAVQAEWDGKVEEERQRVGGLNKRTELLQDMAALARNVKPLNTESEENLKQPKETVLKKATKVMKNITSIFNKRSGSYNVSNLKSKDEDRKR